MSSSSSGMNKYECTLSFSTLISVYQALQSGVVLQIRNLARSPSSATPAAFILLQFQMAQLSQVGESISNVIYNVNNLITYVVNNSK